jgi:hypothetical protein
VPPGACAPTSAEQPLFFPRSFFFSSFFSPPRRNAGGVAERSEQARRDKSDPLVIFFSEIKRCQNPQFTQIVQKAKKPLQTVHRGRLDGAEARHGTAWQRLYTLLRHLCQSHVFLSPCGHAMTLPLMLSHIFEVCGRRILVFSQIFLSVFLDRRGVYLLGIFSNAFSTT